MYFHEPMPAFLTQLAQTPPMLRLREVGMHCGCEYTSFARFHALAPYSRHTHSVRVARIVWEFTHDPAQAVAGLFHDISTPVFAHVVDFLNGDHVKQESTEAGTAQMIEQSAELQQLLRTEGLCTADVEDYHRYPLADNDAPRLSADRLEYTLGNLRSFALAGEDEVAAMYDDLTPCGDELAFRTGELAAAFAKNALICSKIYVSDEDRYSMQVLAELLRSALSRGVLVKEDLHTTEPAVIAKLLADARSCADWQAFRRLSRLQTSATAREGWLRVDAKRRMIDPLIAGRGRVSEVYAQLGAAQREFLRTPLDAWLYAE